MNDIVERKQVGAEITPVGNLAAEANPMSDLVAMMNRAMDSKMDGAAMKEFLEVIRQMMAIQAKQAFAVAMTKFKSECPPIERRTENPQFYATRNGTKVPRKFASIQDIGDQTRPHLIANGLSFRWGDAVIADGKITVPCIVRHVGGHEESTSSTVEIASPAGCSPQQKYGIAETYAMRYSLKKALGITECDEDDNDGNEPPGPCVTESQAANIDALIDDVKADRGRFLRYFGIDRIAELPASRFTEAIKMLEAKRGRL